MVCGARDGKDTHIATAASAQQRMRQRHRLCLLPRRPTPIMGGMDHAVTGERQTLRYCFSCVRFESIEVDSIRLDLTPTRLDSIRFNSLVHAHKTSFDRFAMSVAFRSPALALSLLAHSRRLPRPERDNLVHVFAHRIDSVSHTPVAEPMEANASPARLLPFNASTPVLRVQLSALRTQTLCA
jgi:hypothetical protein